MAGKIAFSLNPAMFTAALWAAVAESKEEMKRNLVEAAQALSTEAQAICGDDTGQLQDSIHVIGPGETDSSWAAVDNDGNTFDNATWLTAKDNEALVVARTQRVSDKKDYAWHHEQGPNSPTFYMKRAANYARGNYPDIDISEPWPI